MKLKKLAEKPEADTIVQSIREIFEMDEKNIKQLNQYKCEYHINTDDNGEKK
jgi:glutamyl-tRNA reductase